MVLASIEEAARRFGAPPTDLDGPGALEELRVHGDYAGDSCTIAPLGFDNVNSISLPPVGSCPVPVEQVGGGAGRYIAERLSSMVLPSALGRARIRDEGPRRLYTDPALRSPRLYKALLGLLMERNLLDFYTGSVCSVGVFFVRKKNNRLRLILDGRRASLHFSAPDKVNLATGATFAGLHVDSGRPIAVGGGGVAASGSAAQPPSGLGRAPLKSLSRAADPPAGRRGPAARPRRAQASSRAARAQRSGCETIATILSSKVSAIWLQLF